MGCAAAKVNLKLRMIGSLLRIRNTDYVPRRAPAPTKSFCHPEWSGESMGAVRRTSNFLLGSSCGAMAPTEKPANRLPLCQHQYFRSPQSRASRYIMPSPSPTSLVPTNTPNGEFPATRRSATVWTGAIARTAKSGHVALLAAPALEVLVVVGPDFESKRFPLSRLRTALGSGPERNPATRARSRQTSCSTPIAWAHFVLPRRSPQVSWL